MVKVSERTAKIAKAMGAREGKMLQKLIGTARVAGTRSSIATKGSMVNRIGTSAKENIKGETGVAGKGGLLEKLLLNNAKDSKTEKSKRRKGLTYGPKAAIATIASLLMLKKIRDNLEKSSGYLGAVVAILGRVLLMALMPIATILGALLMPTTLKLLDIMKNMLTTLKGPLADLIGGKIDVAQFVAIALPIWGDAMREAGGVIGDGLINIAQQLITIWPYVKTQLSKSFDSLAKWMTDNWGIIAPILAGAFIELLNVLVALWGKILPYIGPAFEGLYDLFVNEVWPRLVTLLKEAFSSLMTWLGNNPDIVATIVGLLAIAFGLILGAQLVAFGLAIISALLAAVATAIAAAIIAEVGIVAVAAALAIGVALVAIIAIVLGLLLLAYVYRDKIKETLNNIVNILKTTWDNFINGIVAAIDKFTEGFSSALQSIINAIRNAASNALKGAMNTVGLGKGTTGGKIVSGAATAASTQSGAVGLVGKIGKWLGLAEGGIVNKPTFAMIGEAGPEAVIPLSKMGGMGGGTTNNISINIQADVSSDVDIDRLADQISQKIYDNTRRSTSW